MRTPIQKLDPESYDAMAQLFIPLGKRACPIYASVNGRGYDVIGTAVPVRGQKYAALLTASHVIDELEDGNVVIAGSRSFLRFPAITVRFSHSRPPPAVDVDVAAIALPATAVSELDAYYDFTGVRGNRRLRRLQQAHALRVRRLSAYQEQKCAAQISRTDG
jgi:hypothetical protein